MLCSVCAGEEITDQTSHDPIGGARARPGAAPRQATCAHCGAGLPPREAALLLDKVRMLGRFGLASHTHLLLTREGF